jgi:hypothetical protein
MMRRMPMVVMLLGLVAAVKDEENRTAALVGVGLGVIALTALAVAGAVAPLLAGVHE